MTARRLCRHCAKPIRPLTCSVYCREEARDTDRTTAYSRWVYGTFRTGTDCQRVTNDKVVSIRRHHADPSLIARFTTWDGTSYQTTGGFFCSSTCAIAFAQLMARQGHATQAYVEAVSAQQRDDRPG